MIALGVPGADAGRAAFGRKNDIFSFKIFGKCHFQSDLNGSGSWNTMGCQLFDLGADQ